MRSMKMYLVVKVLLILLLYFAAYVSSSGLTPTKQSRFIMEKIICTNGTKYCSSINCGVTKTVRHSSSMYMSCVLKKPVHTLDIRLVLFYKFRVYQQFLVDILVDFCGYMSGKVQSHILDLVMPVIIPISNLNHTCPYDGNVTVNNLEIDDRILDNTVLPPGQYRIDLAFLTGKRLISSAQIYVLVPRSTIG